MKVNVMTRILVIVGSGLPSTDDIQSAIDNSKSSISSNLVSRPRIVYISPAMKYPNRHILSVLVLLIYIAGAALIEIAHHDETNLLLHSQPALKSHDCGAKEIHVSVENARHCLACSQFAQRFS
ncbi:MAG: hypothetical protein AAB344_07790, partial [Bacteroidota bacterium]